MGILLYTSNINKFPNTLLNQKANKTSFSNYILKINEILKNSKKSNKK